MKLLQSLISGLALAIFSTTAHSANSEDLTLIPFPQEVALGSGSLHIANHGAVHGEEPLRAAVAQAINDQGDYLYKSLSDSSGGGIDFPVGATIRVSPLPGATDPEGYALEVTEKGIFIRANTPVAAYRAATTLRQLIDHSAKPFDEGCDLPFVKISDSPRFQWRGFMLDESRHFTGEEEVKRLLDTMAYYKVNVFHWHLTDSPGWRIEIKKHPKLTTIGATGNDTDPEAAPAFYTQEQIQEIVAYAKARHIKVIPEIDMPGHAAAAIRAYPEHSGGGSKRHPDFTFNPANPKTAAFLSDILVEVAKLFPDAGAIHFGGDEVHFGWKQWPDLPDVKKLMSEEDLPNLRAVEKHFAQRTATVINDLGFDAAGWDEIVDFELDPKKSLVFWWRHDKPKLLTQALEKGYDVVMCPRLPLYFDFVQHDSHKAGRRWGGYCPLEDVYAFPDSLDEFSKRPKTGNVIGIQANLWTETTGTQERRDFLTFPRLLAMAEAGWTEKDNKKWSAFYDVRLKPHLPQLKARGLTIFDPYAVTKDIPK